MKELERLSGVGRAAIRHYVRRRMLPFAPPRSDASLREAIDALVCVAAEVLDISPRSVRPALAAVFARMHGAQLSAEDATRVMLPG